QLLARSRFLDDESATSLMKATSFWHHTKHSSLSDSTSIGGWSKSPNSSEKRMETILALSLTLVQWFLRRRPAAKKAMTS
ncbi:unnamed protein product, partial [Aphanomyces euteiches]